MALLKDEFLAELTREEAHLAEIERQGEAVRSRMEVLRAKLVFLVAESLPSFHRQSRRAG